MAAEFVDEPTSGDMGVGDTWVPSPPEPWQSAADALETVCEAAEAVVVSAIRLRDATDREYEAREILLYQSIDRRGSVLDEMKLRFPNLELIDSRDSL